MVCLFYTLFSDILYPYYSIENNEKYSRGWQKKKQYPLSISLDHSFITFSHKWTKIHNIVGRFSWWLEFRANNSIAIRVRSYYSFVIHITTKIILASINESKLSCFLIEKLCFLCDSKFWIQRTRTMNTSLQIGRLQQIRGSDSLWMVL